MQQQWDNLQDNDIVRAKKILSKCHDILVKNLNNRQQEYKQNR